MIMTAELTKAACTIQRHANCCKPGSRQIFIIIVERAAYRTVGCPPGSIISSAQTFDPERRIRSPAIGLL
jgi:hypothetical protein